MLPLIPFLLTLTLSPQADSPETDSQEDVLELRDDPSGATIPLPAGWSLATSEKARIAVSADRRAFLLVSSTETDFDRLKSNVAGLLATHLDAIALTEAGVVEASERGAFEGLFLARGRGVSRIDGEGVEFRALIARSGEGGALALGGWKDEQHAALVHERLADLRVERVAGDAGLEVGDPATGATLTLPPGWRSSVSRQGLVAGAPERRALVVIVPWRDGFDAAAAKVRDRLLQAELKDVELGRFGIAEASYSRSLGQVISASGTAIDRQDQQPVTFTALRVERLDLDRGSAVFGAWKDEQHAREVAALLESIEIRKREKTEKVQEG